MVPWDWQSGSPQPRAWLSKSTTGLSSYSPWAPSVWESTAAVSEQPLGCAFVPQTEPLFLGFLLEKREGREQKLTAFLIFLDLRISSQG